jgi:hypothetical protein
MAMSRHCYKCKPFSRFFAIHPKGQQFSTMEHLKLLTLTFAIAFRICSATSVSNLHATQQTAHSAVETSSVGLTTLARPSLLSVITEERAPPGGMQNFGFSQRSYEGHYLLGRDTV